MYKKIIPYINCENELQDDIIKKAIGYETTGADELYVFHYSKDEDTHEKFLEFTKTLTKKIDIPILIGSYVKRFEDVKKALYTGASYAVIRYDLLADTNVIKEAIERFGKDKVIIEMKYEEYVLDKNFIDTYSELGIYALIVTNFELTENFTNLVATTKVPILLLDNRNMSGIISLLKANNVIGIATNDLTKQSIYQTKLDLKNQGIPVNTFESAMSFAEFKLNKDGLITVVTQDYKTSEVLMVAYMNEEAFNKTVETGIMTYYSRSRQSLWIKGETSGNYQYMKSLKIDCDKDTILAKVHPIGPACHTGNQTCFFTDLVKKEYDDTNPLTVFTDVYDIIMDRKKNPKEGSYTNYLFNKGIDKILKKCGEEATEIVIAAKNPNAEELKYEISDFLYHMMVLMAECNVDWNDIVKELAHRR